MILCCRDYDSDVINQEIHDTFPGQVTVHGIMHASDPNEGIDHSDVCPVEFLGSLVMVLLCSFRTLSYHLDCATEQGLS